MPYSPLGSTYRPGLCNPYPYTLAPSTSPSGSAWSEADQKTVRGTVFPPNAPGGRGERRSRNRPLDGFRQRTRGAPSRIQYWCRPLSAWNHWPGSEARPENGPGDRFQRRTGGALAARGACRLPHAPRRRGEGRPDKAPGEPCQARTPEPACEGRASHSDSFALLSSGNHRGRIWESLGAIHTTVRLKILWKNVPKSSFPYSPDNILGGHYKTDLGVFMFRGQGVDPHPWLVYSPDHPALRYSIDCGNRLSIWQLYEITVAAKFNLQRLGWIGMPDLLPSPEFYPGFQEHMTVEIYAL